MSGVAERALDFEAATALDTSERESVFVIAAANDAQIRLSASAHRLLCLRRSGVTSEEIAAELSAAGRPITGAEIESRYEDLLRRIQAIEGADRGEPPGFWFRLPILPERTVVRLAGRLRTAFTPWAAVVLLAVIFSFVVAMAVTRPKMSAVPADFWIGFGLFFASIFVHEVGHASACAHFGVPPKEIGATLYLIFPALYSNVTGAWRLRRMERVVVDLAGLYFQLATGSLFFAFWYFYRWPPLLTACALILGSTLFSLNPIFKFDGYWVVADALGVTNLSRQPVRVLHYLRRRLLGKPVEALPWPGGVIAALAAYSVASFVIWGWFFWRLAPRLRTLVLSLPADIAAFASAASGAPTALALLRSVFLSAVSLFVAWRFAKMLLVPLWSVLRKATGETPAGHASPRPVQAAPRVPR